MLLEGTMDLIIIIIIIINYVQVCVTHSQCLCSDFDRNGFVRLRAYMDVVTQEAAEITQATSCTFSCISRL